MTIAPVGRPAGATSAATAVDALRARGLRVTGPRRRLLAALFAAEAPMSAEALAAGADLASVYRNLETFEAAGLTRHVHLGHGPARYAPNGAYWTACERCGRHERLPATALAHVRALVRAATGLDSDFAHFPIVGLCPECANVP